MADLSGRVLGSYSLLKRIGQGGMASVYLARDRVRGRELALKVLSPVLAENQQFLLRFRREARVVAGLKHPHIVPLDDFGEIDGYAYLAMPFYPSRLTERMALGAWTPAEALRLVGQVAAALEYAHRQGVVHRDVKPSNILLDPQSNAMLSDFGLAQIQDASVSLTGSALVGTPAYVSPEQVRGDPVDRRADQYSLGIVLFQITTGRLPFEAATPMALLVKHANEPMPDPSRLNPSLPSAIDQVIRTATSKDPEDRYASVSELAEAFQRAMEGPAGKVGRSALTLKFARSAEGQVSRPRRRNRPRRRWPIPVGIGAGLAALLATWVVLGGGGGLPAGDDPSDARLTALQQTISSLSTGIAASGGTVSPEFVATQVAATLTASGGTPEPGTGTPTPPGSPTSGARPSTATPAPTRGQPTAAPSPTSLPPSPAPSPTSPPPTSVPSPTPLLPLPTLPLGINVLRRTRGRALRTDPGRPSRFTV